MNPPPRVQRGHVRRPGHSPQRTVSDGYTCLGIGSDCSDCNCDGGIGLRRGCDRRTRSSSLARRRVLPCSGRQERLVHNLRRSAQIDLHVSPKPCISAVPPLVGVYLVAAWVLGLFSPKLQSDELFGSGWSQFLCFLSNSQVVRAPYCAPLSAQPRPAAGRATPWPGPPCDRPPQSASVEEVSRLA